MRTSDAASRTARSKESIHSEQTGCSQSRCCTRRYPSRASQRLCQCPGPELPRPGTNSTRACSEDAVIGQILICICICNGIVRTRREPSWSHTTDADPIHEGCFADCHDVDRMGLTGEPSGAGARVPGQRPRGPIRRRPHRWTTDPAPQPRPQARAAQPRGSGQAARLAVYVRHERRCVDSGA